MRRLVIAVGLSAVNTSLSWVQVILLGTLDCLEADLKTDQNFLLFVFSKLGRDWKYCLRLE